MKFLKSLSVCVMALASLFVFAGCNSGTLVENPSDELKQSIDTAWDALATTTTDYTVTGNMIYTSSSNDIHMNATENMNVTVSGEGEDFKIHSSFVEDGRFYSDNAEQKMSSNCNYYMEANETGYALYESRSQTTTTGTEYSACLSAINLDETLGANLGLSIENFYGEDSYAADEYQIYSLGTDSYRVDIEVIEGSTDATSLSYKKTNNSIYVTDGQVVQIYSSRTIQRRDAVEDDWDNEVLTYNFSISYTNTTVTLPNTVNYTSISWSRFPDCEIF